MGIKSIARILVKPLTAVFMLAVVVIAVVYAIYIRIPDPDGFYRQDPLQSGSPVNQRTPAPALAQRQQLQNSARVSVTALIEGRSANRKQILFGDTHVHTTWSFDAFMFSLPIMNASQGAYPPAAACDYARYVSQLDFYFLTDHAESYTSQRWRDAQEAIRHCNAVSGNPDNPDLVAFLGFEWSQFGMTADDHFGHHNVLFRDTQQDLLPPRPIGAAGAASDALRGTGASGNPVGVLQWLDSGNRSYYRALDTLMSELQEEVDCSADMTTSTTDCYESAADPGELYKKLDQWGFDTLVIPHGSAWGIYTPPGASWEHQLKQQYHDPDKARLIEVYSGHGNSENYRNFQTRPMDEQGRVYCPAPQANYLPACWQAGVIIQERCLEKDTAADDCARRAAVARQHYVEVDHVGGWRTVPGATVADWLDAGQARDVFLPAFNYRPKKSVQYSLALRNFDDPKNPLGYKWGFIGSSDTHFSRPGNGFKQYPRIGTGDAGMRGTRNPFWDWLIYRRNQEEASDHSRAEVPLGGDLSEQERKMSFLTAGGVVAIHAEGRDRGSIWNAMKRREVYGTSGHRLLLWFDVLNSGDHPKPMGSEVELQEAPQFRVSAVGSFKQLPGCPDYVKRALSAKKLQYLARDECYNPSEERYLIDRIEVVRIKPQITANEPVDRLIEDSWRVFECVPDAAGCSVEFSDADFPSSARDTIYYVRAIEEPSPTINGDNLRAERNAAGLVATVNPCYGDFRIGNADNCQAMKGQRAWSSPIFVNFLPGKSVP
ncbi:MAG: hypothetical protein ACI9GW_002465 [Halieaceae bacterium]|jgi:hypothetical protein